MRPVEALLRVLRDEGVTKVFGNPGTTELPFLDALVDAPDIEYVLGAHEGSLVAMADGYARATRRPAFVSLHVAAGLANGLVGLLNASRSRTPMVVTAGQQDRRHLVQDPMLSGDLVGLAAAAVKHTFDVRHAPDLPLLLRRAFRLAVQPPAGPVFLSIPMDLLAEDTDVELPARSVVWPPGPASGVADAVAALGAARDPVIVAGDGVGRANAVAELVAVAEALDAPVFHQPLFDGIDFPTTHPLYAGMLPGTNAGIRNELAAHDVVFIVGCHAFMPHHYTPGPAIPPGTRVVQLDDDPAEPGRNFAVSPGLVGDIRSTLAELAGRLPRRPGGRVVRQPDVDVHYGSVPLEPLVAAHAVASGLPEDAVVVEEAITTGVLLRRVLRQSRPGSYVHTIGGGLGSGIGAAVGTRMGEPTRPVVAVLGDGCALFGLHGLWSAARYDVAVTFVVMRNGEYRTLKETLDSWDSRATRAGRYPGLDLGELDFTKAGDFFGIPSLTVGSAAELRDVVAKAGGRTGPLLVDVPILGHGS
ncbi:benzoylformate decarboxylase [Saccharothrix ecbatanensis]|uniref:Benzoylformate decarboxylase n=1 Tax=Saccharothrix ecbatanensis TaxID=1105145 RepID=A0A7W9M0U6_9PSEU|nr:thiamine pyrophosphate-binding protein [Saccharothrix ecbatanensis]MBB5803231.1 benzoylformate decarboxylase [Saccharothrix ecbatanensis]